MNVHKWRDAVLSPGGPGTIVTRAVLCGIAKHADKKTGECWPSVKTLAANLNSNRQTVADHIAIAVEAGWLEKVERDGKSHVFRLTLPTEGADRTSTGPANEIGTPEEGGCQGDWHGVPRRLAGGAKEIGTNTFKNPPENTSTSLVDSESTEGVDSVEDEPDTLASNDSDSDAPHTTAHTTPPSRPSRRSAGFPTLAQLRKARPTPRDRIEYPPPFEDAWTAYPTREPNPKAKAYDAWRARTTEGYSPEDLTSAAASYAELVKAEGRPPSKVQQAATFFGAGLHVDEYRDKPAGYWKEKAKAETKATEPPKQKNQPFQRFRATELDRWAEEVDKARGWRP